MKCSQADSLLNAYLDGELSEVERSAVDEHVRRCAACAAALHGLKGTVALVSSLPRRPAPAGFASEVQQRVEEEAESARARAVRPAVRRHRLVLAFAQRAAAAVVMLLVGFAGYVALRPETATERPDLARRFEVGEPAVATDFASEDARGGGAAGRRTNREAAALVVPRRRGRFGRPATARRDETDRAAAAGPPGTNAHRAAAKPRTALVSAPAARDKAHDSYAFDDGLDQTLQVSRASIRSNDVPTAVRTVRTILATNGWLAGKEAGRDEGGDGKAAEPEAPVKIFAVVPEAEMLALQNALASREDLWTVNFGLGHKRRVRAPAEESRSVVRLAKAVDTEGRAAEARKVLKDARRERAADRAAGEALKERAVGSSAGPHAGRSGRTAQDPTARASGVAASPVPAADRLDLPSDADTLEGVKAAPKPEVERTGRVMDELAQRSAGEAEERDALGPAMKDSQKKETAAPPSPSCRPVATVPPAAPKGGTPDRSAAIDGRSVPKTKSPAVEHKAALADVTTTGEGLLRKQRRAGPNAPRRGLAAAAALTTRPAKKHAAARPEPSPSPPAFGGNWGKDVPEGPGRPAGQSWGGSSGKPKKDVSPCESRLAAADKPAAAETAQRGRQWRAPTSRPAATAVEALHIKVPTTARTRRRSESAEIARRKAARRARAAVVYHVTIVIEPQRPADSPAARQ